MYRNAFFAICLNGFALAFTWGITVTNIPWLFDRVGIKETDLVSPHSQIMDQTKPVGNIVISKEIANDCICLAVINQVDSSSELTVNEKSIELL